MTSFATYAALPAVNWSTLKAMSVSPLHYAHTLSHPRSDTAAMAKGRAVHVAVLEPLRLPLLYTTWDGTRRGPEWTKFKEANAGKEILTVPEYEDIVAISAAVRSHPEARRLLRGGKAEQTILWTDPATRLRCKARVDYVRRDALVDLKTTRSLDERDFQRTFTTFKYYCQLAMYLDGLAANGHALESVYIVAVESEPPHDVAVFEPSEDAIYAGQQEVHELLALVRRYRRRKRLPGRYPKTTALDLPGWYYAQAEAEMEARL